MKLEKELKFTIHHNSQCLFRILSPEDVSQSYINALKSSRGPIKNVPEDIDIKWQQGYIKKILQSPCDTICGLFIGSELIGTSGIQNLSAGGSDNRAIELAQGHTCGCTLGILVLDEALRGRGYGKTLVWAACYLANNCCGVGTFAASMGKTNLPSLKSFLACGFQVREESPGGVNVELKIGELVKPEFVERIIVA